TECHPTTNGRVQFSLTAGSAGNYALPVRVSTSVGSIATTATFAVLDEPVLEIANVTAPSTVGFADTLSVEFFVRKRSFSPGYNVSIAVGSFDQITVPVLDTDRQLTFVILGADLDVGQNSIPLQVKWHDDEGKKYSVETEITIDLLPQNFWQRILLLLRDMERWIRSLGN
ncbi:MAG TPA: hypothetical protein VJK52_03820, partial [Candidatus Nanoarchaeia archaeon]|nr:hypothetical protein [Candidatus Nanoarchaeia archaeon]